jgi:uncharacterized protein (TIGR03663 family)
MNRWSALAAVLLAFVAALALRLPQLSARPLHNDEAVNAIKINELLQTGRYKYDPHEYHGPTLHYASVPFLWAGGKNEITDATLRWVTVFFGAALVFLLLLFRDGLDRAALAWSALFIAISPAMVFYSRYFIHEMLLVFFTALAIGAGWKYFLTKCPAWAALAGAAVGLMYATKETFVITVAAITGAILFTWLITGRQKIVLPLRHAAAAFGAFVFVWALLFTSFFTNLQGIPDSVRTYLPWLERAGGKSPHIHPWYFYLERLAWFHPVKSPIWTELLIVVLAVIGTVAGIRKKVVLPTFLAFYTVLLTTAYSVISYKTPWCMLSFLLGMILLAGYGASTVVAMSASRTVKIVTTGVIVVFAGQLTYQARRASVAFTSDRKNPYVYAQTVPDIHNLTKKAFGVAAVAPGGYETAVKVITPGGDYWPLPWYLRRFRNVGWYEEMPADPFAPIMIVGARMDARLDDKSDKKWVMVGYHELRPQIFLEMYVELELWRKYVATLAPEKD